MLSISPIRIPRAAAPNGAAYLGAIAQLVRCQVDFAKAAFSYELAQRIVADVLQVRCREFTI